MNLYSRTVVLAETESGAAYSSAYIHGLKNTMPQVISLPTFGHKECKVYQYMDSIRHEETVDCCFRQYREDNELPTLRMEVVFR